MRVFQLNTFCGVKSTGRIAYEIARLVKADGGECRIGYGVPGILPESEPFAYRIGTPMERKLHGAARKLLDAEGYGSRCGTRKLVQEMERFQPDLVHMHNLHGCYLNLDLLFGYLKKIDKPVVWTLHDCWPFTGHCAYFDAVGCQRWQTGCYSCPQKAAYPVCMGISGAKRNFAHKKKLFTSLKHLLFVAPCQWMTHPLSRSFLANYPVRVIPNGIDLAAFHPTPSDVTAAYQGQKIVLAVAAEWDERKGLRFLIQAAKKLGAEYRFVVIGLDENQMAALPKEMTGLTHTANVKELAAWYTAADCLVNPTLEDNMPMVNLEALACGTPVAVFATGGCPEAADESCGRVVPKGDVDGLCRAIVQLCQQDHTSACLKRAQSFDCKRTFQRYLDLYKELCS